MATDYEQLFRATPDALGQPSKVLVAYFEALGPGERRILDMGCGQGRDALCAARLGHLVVAVDLSATGIRQLRDAAAAEALPITAVAADIRKFEPEGLFDVILFDRTLHMLAPEDRVAVLKLCLPHSVVGTEVLIRDETRNLPALAEAADRDAGAWETVKRQRGSLFLRRVS